MSGHGERSDEGAKKMETENIVYMWGYLPGASPLLSPTAVTLSHSTDIRGSSWKDVCGGGCGFATAISDSGRLITWGSTDDLGQSYITSGKHGEKPEPFPLPAESSIINAAAGWAHCVAVTENGEIYTWGWKECVPSGKMIGDQGVSLEKDIVERQNSLLTEQVSPRSQGSRSSSGGSLSGGENKEESRKRRRLSTSKQTTAEILSPSSGDEALSSLPCLVTLSPGVKISTVATGGRHTIVLSDTGQVWGWGYGGEGQLGIGSRIRMVSSPHPVPCIGFCSQGGFRIPGNYVRAIACGGRHSAVITDAGALLTFGWGLYGQCGQGSIDDEVNPVCVSSLLGIKIKSVAAGLWHTVCISTDGDVYAFGGNQFGQLGTGNDQAETLPKLLESPRNANVVSSGARHSAVLTDDGKVFCWGWNKYGQLDLGDVIDRNIPNEVSIGGCCIPKNIACGWWHTLLLAT